MIEESGREVSESSAELSDEQKRRLRAVRRGYRVDAVEVKDNGWKLEVRYLDGSSVIVDAKLLKIKADQLLSK